MCGFESVAELRQSLYQSVAVKQELRKQEVLLLKASIILFSYLEA